VKLFRKSTVKSEVLQKYVVAEQKKKLSLAVAQLHSSPPLDFGDCVAPHPTLFSTALLPKYFYERCS